MDGKVVGVNSWHRLEAQNLNFAISATAIIMLKRKMSSEPLPLSSLLVAKRPSPREDKKKKRYATPSRLDITLPSGAVLRESMLGVPDHWQDKYFPKTATVYLATSPNGDIRGVFTLDDAKLDGWAIALYESGHFQTLAFFKRANMDGRMIQWKENGERLLYAEHKCGNKHGLYCLFQDDLPWLIQEWNKKKIQNEYLVKYVGGLPNLTPKSQMNDEESEEYGRAISELALLEATLKKNEKHLKQDLAKWYRKELKRLKRARQTKSAPDKLRRQLNRIDELNKTRRRKMLEKRYRAEGRM